MKQIISNATLILVLASVSWAQGPTQFHPGFNLFSKQQDVQLGQENAAQVRAHMKVIRNPVLNDYVNKVGRRLVAAREAQESGFPFTFEVVADPTINAFALPGGPMFINTGLLRAVDNEDQLAGVMGHEMSHVILRHGTSQATKSKLVELPAVLGSQVAGGSLVGQLTKLGIGLGANSVLLKFSRSAESQADLMGSHLMAESGYNPMEMARFFEKLNQQGGQRTIQFLSDHPNPENREKAIEEEVHRLPDQPYTYQTGDFQHMKAFIARVREPKPPAPAKAQ